MRYLDRNLVKMFRLSDIIAAIGFLTRIPVGDGDSPSQAEGAWAWVVAGCVVGLIAGTAAAVVLALSSSPILGAICGLIVLVLLTGGLHEDGLADTADGLWGGDSPSRRLEIMHDSRIGAYACMALTIVFLARFAGIAEASGSFNPIAVFTASAVVSRAVMLVSMHLVPFAREDGMAVAFGRPPARAAAAGAALAAIIALICVGLQAFPMILAAALAGAALGFAVHRLTGGHTGDSLGATQQVAEIACLLCLAAYA
ncbi:MAG: adenosylcobinamide-GDP ribazoletransferase [Rhodobacteraceae bacterium]|nr:adenosylcobinamide-GDP ribazoletransferase [Paracoccaceae bacterium]